MNNSRYISVPHVLKEYKINTAHLLYIIVTEVMIKSEKKHYIYINICVCVPCFAVQGTVCPEQKSNGIVMLSFI